jgi:hypothetical protein
MIAFTQAEIHSLSATDSRSILVCQSSCFSMYLKNLEIGGTPSRIRTCDPLLRRQMLYPTELWAHIR